MARRKRTSNVLETARQRLAGLKSIKTVPDFGEDLSLISYEAEINAFATAVAAYNQELSSLDEKQNAVIAAEKALRDKNKRMLRVTEAKYRSDSSEFEQAGGKRVSEHKRRAKKATGSNSNGSGAPDSGSPKP